MTPLRLIPYVRTSTQDQADRYGPQTQIDGVTGWAEKYGATLVCEPFIDETTDHDDISERTELWAAVAKLEELKADGLLVMDRSRYARDPTQMGMLDYEVRKRGGWLFSADGAGNSQDPNDISDLIHKSVMDIMSKIERIKIVMRTKPARRTRSRDGFSIGTPPYGYMAKHVEKDGKIRRGYLEVIPEEKEVVCWIFQQVAAGKRAPTITAQLTRKAADNPAWAPRSDRGDGKPWAMSTVRKIMANQDFYMALRVRSQFTGEKPPQHTALFTKADLEIWAAQAQVPAPKEIRTGAMP